MQSATGIRVGRGPRAVEELLRAEREELIEQGRREPALLSPHLLEHACRSYFVRSA